MILYSEVGKKHLFGVISMLGCCGVARISWLEAMGVLKRAPYRSRKAIKG